MMQNLLLTSFTPLKSKNEINCWENRPFATVWPENVQQNKQDVTRTIKKKKRVRSAFSTYQLWTLEKKYSDHKYIKSVERAEIANRLKISDKSVKVWFQNRRMKEKRKSSESSCDSSSEYIVSTEPLSVHTPLPFQVINEPTTTEQITEQISHYPDNTYQVPTYCKRESSESSCDSSSEYTVSTEPLSVHTPPPLQVINEPTTTEQITEQISHYPDNTYQVPTYCNTNELQSTYKVIASSGSATYFYNERAVYPTQYYPHDSSFSNGGHWYDHYASEGNGCWTGSQYPYYPTT